MDIRIVNSDIEGMIIGIKWSAAGTGLQVVENSTLRNQTDMVVKTMYSSNGPSWLPPRTIIANNVNFLGSTTVGMSWDVSALSNTTQRDTVLVYGYKGVASDNFQVYYNQQATQNVAGGLAPCANQRSEINGIVCGTAASRGPVITWVNPFQGSTGGGTPTTLFGANFVSGATASFGGTPGTNVIVSPNTITATAPAHAAGNVNVTVTNPAGSTSTFTNGFRYTTAPGCSYTVSPTTQSVALGGGSGSAGVTTTTGCAWSATSQASWISITSGTSGSGSATVTYSVAANSGAARTGTLTVAGKTVTISQQGQACSFSVAPTSVAPGAAGGAQSASVTTAAGCNWTAASNASWISVTAGASGSGNGTVSYTVAGNSGAATRTGTLTVAGQTITVTQAGQTCSYTVSPTSVAAAATGGAQSATVTAAAGCSWTAVSNAAWISVTAGSTGSGNGTVSYSVDANSSTTSRAGTLTVAGQMVTVTQAGQTTSTQPTCPCTIWSASTTPAYITGDSQPVELGVKFRSDVNGVITGVRFYKGATNTGTHVGNLWTSTGTRLASATFANETASGWQQVTFATPVAVSANTTYIASYHTDTGNYALNGSYFAAAGADKPPLHALANGVDGPNAVFVYGASAFPTQTFGSNNYWVDVVFNTSNASPADTTPPTVTSATPANNGTSVNATTMVTATFSEAMNASTITTGTFVLRDPANALVPAAVSYNTTTRVATLDPSQALSAATKYTATISGGSAGAKDAAGNPLASSFTWSFTTASSGTACPCTIWNPAATPASISSDSRRVEIGVKFRSEVNGVITGIRFYKGSTNTGTHVAHLWTRTGTLLATATFTNETASGWQQVTFSTPVAISANTTYIASYHTNAGHYGLNSGYFLAGAVDSPPLHTLGNGVDGSNGVFVYGKSAFPTQPSNGDNYWVDVVFTPQ
jgi:hypothetical protein